MKRICTGILAHVDAGKTTLCEAMLYRSGALRALGRVDHGDAFLDTQSIERERGITIFSKQASVALGETELVLLDTPGHVDFSSEMERTLQVLDYAVLLISGTDGVQGHTRTLWGLLRRYQIPTFLFVIKLPRGKEAQERCSVRLCRAKPPPPFFACVLCVSRRFFRLSKSREMCLAKMCPQFSCFRSC